MSSKIELQFSILISILLLIFGTFDNVSCNRAPLKIHINSTSTIPPQLNPFILQAQATLYHWHPLISTYLSSPNYTSPPTIILSFENCTRFSAASHNFGNYGRITACTPHFLKNPNDLIPALITTLTFIIQNYNVVPRPPRYVTWGIAQYVKRFLVEKKSAKDLPKPSSNSSFNPETRKMDELAYFFNYVNVQDEFQTVLGELKVDGMDLIQVINWEAREGRFNESFWEKGLGKGVNQIWKEMVAEEKMELTIKDKSLN